ncbi:uncharacterized protein LOC124822679 [Vigna umbellata]|uniref:uncharacterized protein LOC124822679 n=1 Tax=Vigna umbellata TaxID=87088 RepID=UPI001F5FA9B3|nr:uncharacterized protein LOC124822679 [Vigna umbellata]
MACCYKYHYLFLHSHSLWRKLPLLPNSTTRTFSRNLRTPTLFHSSDALHSKGYCSASTDSLGAVPATSSALVPDTAFGTGQVLRLGSAAKGERVTNADPLNSRVMIIDGTSIIHRAYYKLLGSFRFLCSFLLAHNCTVHFFRMWRIIALLDCGA